MSAIDILLLLQLIFTDVQTIQVGFIQNVSLIASDTSDCFVYGSCDACLCAMLNSNQTIVSFNCYKNNGTCHLFTNYLQTVLYQLKDKSESIFYFLKLPPKPITSLFWSFDGSINEAFDRVDVIPDSHISFVSPGVYGRGSAIYFNGSQYFNGSSTYLNLSSNSFTFEMWIYLQPFVNGASSRYGMLGQCGFTSTSACLHLEIRSLTVHFGFYSNDCSGYTTLINSTWYHLAFVYNATARKQLIFLNGELECSRTANALQNISNAPLTIGTDLLVTGGVARRFRGYIDQLSYVNIPKDAGEIFDDATLVAYFSFNQGSLLDSGPNTMTGTAYQLVLINDSLLFNQTFSSFQVESFDLSGISNSSSSIAFWINPFLTNGSTIVRLLLNNTTNNLSCWDMIGFDSQGTLISQIRTSGIVSIMGPQLLPNIWTHVSQTYSLTNGLKLYVNGTFVNGTGPLIYMNIQHSQTITLGNCSQGCHTCERGLMEDSSYVGLIDELRIYSRELNSSDIQSLVRR